MERGTFLRDLKRPAAGPRVPMMLAVALDIARAVEFLHSHGIVHGGAAAWDAMAEHELCSAVLVAGRFAEQTRSQGVCPRQPTQSTACRHR